MSLIERMRQANLEADVRVLFGQPTLIQVAASVGTMQRLEVPQTKIPTLIATPYLKPLHGPSDWQSGGPSPSLFLPPVQPPGRASFRHGLSRLPMTDSRHGCSNFRDLWEHGEWDVSHVSVDRSPL